VTTNPARPLDIVGSSIGCIVTALQLAERGRPTRIFLQRGREGGSFHGTHFEGRCLDLGVRLFELDYEDAPAERLPIAEFDRDRNNHRPFIDAVANFIRRFIGNDIERVEPEMFLSGRRGRCIHFTTDLSGLPDLLDSGDRARMREEVAAILADPTAPPWRFRAGRPVQLDDVTLPVASVDNHGVLFHDRLVRAHCARQSPDWEQTIASERRKLWIALFHPTTLAAALNGEASPYRPYRPFYRAPAGLLVERLLEALHHAPLVEIVPIGRLTRFSCRGDVAMLDFAEAGEAPARSIEIAAGGSILGLSGDELFPAAGIAYGPRRIRSGVAWVEIPESEILHWPALLSIHDPAMAILRVSTTSGGAPEGWRIATIETGSEAPHFDALREELAAIGMVRSGGAMRLLKSFHGSAQIAATFDNRARFDVARDAFAARGWAGRVLAPARRFGFESLNDLIVEALHTAEEQC
jgi:hypothetical protein